MLDDDALPLERDALEDVGELGSSLAHGQARHPVGMYRTHDVCKSYLRAGEGEARCRRITGGGVPSRLAPYLTTSEAVSLQSPSPALVTGLQRNSTVAPTVSPVTVVFAWRVTGASVHVLPPSVLVCHS
jgi:hypothetical protein